MKKFVTVLLSFIGLANANVNLKSAKLDSVAQVNENAQLVLESSKAFQDKNIKMEMAYHYSHRSHYSHYSHQSHYSHYSSYDDSYSY